MQKTDIILAGVGGQGILSVAAIIGHAAVANGLYLKQSETHGMSQRGGDVQSHLRIASDPIASDLIPRGRADLILSVEPMESLRYLPYLHEQGWVVTSTAPYENIPNYPDHESLLAALRGLPRCIAFDAEAVAKEAKASKASNVVILGAAAHLLMVDYESLKAGISALFSRKGSEVVEMNLQALEAGRAIAQEHLANRTEAKA